MRLTKQYATAGKAVFTVAGPDKHYTFRISKGEQRPGDTRPAPFFASLLTGGDNENSYTYLGMVNVEKGELFLTKASRFPAGSEPVRALAWALRKTWAEEALPSGFSITASGRCGRCGRTLTRPEGIEDEGYRKGFGPECWDKIQNAA
jgi:hypothetical protein